MKKRLTAILVAALMVMALFPVAAMAEPAPDAGVSAAMPAEGVDM